MEHNKTLYSQDPEMHAVVQEEATRQRVKLEMIASENYTSDAVMAVTGSCLTNKYAEGYPGKRYYGGCEVVDKAEHLAIERAKELFEADYANVQPHCGSSANMAVYMGFLNPGDKVLGMDLAHGGHLTHGSKANFSGKQYDVVSYGVNKETELIDYDEVESIVGTHKPKMIIAGASAYSRIIDFKKFSEIATKHNALLLVDMAHIAGLVAAGEHPSPLPYADVVTTTTHKTLRGPRGGLILVGKNKENFLGITTASGVARKYSAIINSVVFPGTQGGPLMHVIAAKAVAFKECMSEEFKTYQKQVRINARVLAQVLSDGGVKIVSGGTDNHIVLLDLRSVGLTGKDAEEWLDEVNISTNKNTVPFDTESPFVTSGVRLGSPTLTSRGMKEEEMKFVGEKILETLKTKGDMEKLEKIGLEIKNFSEKYPIRV